jgi:hypothetical protein
MPGTTLCQVYRMLILCVELKGQRVGDVIHVFGLEVSEKGKSRAHISPTIPAPTKRKHKETIGYL